MQGRWKNQSDFFRRKINIAYFYILFAKSYSLSKVYGFERDKTYKRWIAIDENIVKVYTDFITCFVFLGKIYKSDQFQGRENKNMKNMKVRTKLNLILVLVILLVALGSVVFFKGLEDVKDKALETMDASSRQSYDDSIKEQVGVVISLLSEINDAYKAGTYTLDEAKKIAADEVRQMRYGETGYFWIDQSDGTNVVLLGSDTEGTNRMETEDAKGYKMVKEIIRVAVEDGGGYTDYVFPKEGETKPSPKRSYSEYFEPFDWVVGTGNYTDYIDTAIEKQDKEGRFWNLCNGGKIQYVKYPIDYNMEAVKTLIRRAMEKGFYEGVNLSLAYCDDCGHQELEMDVCPKCGSHNLTKIDRMNGYLSYSRVHGDTRLNDAKMAEIAERKSM